MVNVLVVAFLLLHGAVHLGVWMPHPPAADGTPVPFEPDHSAVLSRASVGAGVERRIATALAYATAAAYVGAGLAVAAGNSWAVGVAVLASALGLTLKALFFNPWLTLGVALDLLVLSAAVLEWPVSPG